MAQLASVRGAFQAYQHRNRLAEASSTITARVASSDYSAATHLLNPPRNHLRRREGSCTIGRLPRLRDQIV